MTFQSPFPSNYSIPQNIMPTTFRRSCRLNASAEAGDLETSIASASLGNDEITQQETLRHGPFSMLRLELKRAEKRAVEAEQRAAALTKSSAPSTPGTPPSQSDKSQAITDESPVHSDPQFSRSPVKNIMNELLDKPISPAPVPTFKKMFDVPLPRQGEFNGTMAWEGFIRPFMSLAEICGWSAGEKKFRLISNLKGKAAEFVFQQLDASTIEDFDKLVTALESRFAEHLPRTLGLLCSRARNVCPKTAWLSMSQTYTA